MKYHIGRYPHEFSERRGQRICIARVLAIQPKFIIADEPVLSLDLNKPNADSVSKNRFSDNVFPKRLYDGAAGI